MFLPLSLCPSCGNPLSFDYDDNHVWCGNGRCPSEMADNGLELKEFESPAEAADRLIEELNKVRDWEGDES